MTRMVEDKLREEYIKLLPEMHKIQYSLETRIRFALIETVENLQRHERIDVHSRIKGFDSAHNKLLRTHIEFSKKTPEKYNLCDLKDLVGVRILVFPRNLVSTVDRIIIDSAIGSFTEDPFESKEEKELPAKKYYGRPDSQSKIKAEYQIVPILIGNFWDVEHDTIYKPAQEHRAARMLMKKSVVKVYQALQLFEDQFEEVLKKQRKATSKNS